MLILSHVIVNINHKSFSIKKPKLIFKVSGKSTKGKEETIHTRGFIIWINTVNN